MQETQIQRQNIDKDSFSITIDEKRKRRFILCSLYMMLINANNSIFSIEMF